MGLLSKLTTMATLKQKLTAIIMLVSLVVVLLASGAFILATIISYQQDITNRLQLAAAAIATDLALPVSQKNSAATHQILETNVKKLGLSGAAVFSANGEPFALFTSDDHDDAHAATGAPFDRSKIAGVVQSKKQHHFFTSHHFSLIFPLSDQSGIVGALELRSDLTEFYQFIFQVISGTIATILFLGFVAFFLSTRLQKLISSPIRQLADTIDSLSASNDFSIRAKQTSQDEIGDLIQGFNAMLEQLELREEQLKCHRQNLEEMVMQRTHELQDTNMQLQQIARELKIAKQTAEHSTQAKSKFLTKIDQELRKSMSDFTEMTERLKGNGLSGEENDLIFKVEQAGKRLIRILEDAHNFSKIEARGISCATIPFSIPALYDEIITSFNEQATKKNLILACHVDCEKHRHFIGDPDRIKLALRELVGNALKFTDKGEVLLSASCTGDGQQKTIWLAVTDSGVGIPECEQEGIFEQFTRASSSASHNTSGLAKVRKLAHQMGGSCGLQSRPGKGSTFWIVIDLPLAEDEKELDSQQTWTAPERSLNSDRPYILLVEDNPTTQKLMQLILGKTGYRLDTLDNGANAVKAMSETRYDLVFMDCEMPEMDGVEATRTLRQSNDDTPIIALTAHVKKEDIARCLDAGMNDYLTKPFRQQQIFDMIAKWSPKPLYGLTSTAPAIQPVNESSSR